MGHVKRMRDDKRRQGQHDIHSDCKWKLSQDGRSTHHRHRIAKSPTCSSPQSMKSTFTVPRRVHKQAVLRRMRERKGISCQRPAAYTQRRTGGTVVSSPILLLQNKRRKGQQQKQVRNFFHAEFRASEAFGRNHHADRLRGKAKDVDKGRYT